MNVLCCNLQQQIFPLISYIVRICVFCCCCCSFFLYCHFFIYFVIFHTGFITNPFFCFRSCLFRAIRMSPSSLLVTTLITIIIILIVHVFITVITITIITNIVVVVVVAGRFPFSTRNIHNQSVHSGRQTPISMPSQYLMVYYWNNVRECLLQFLLLHLV